MAFYTELNIQTHVVNMKWRNAHGKELNSNNLQNVVILIME
jgi:hypothetical protein